MLPICWPLFEFSVLPYYPAVRAKYWVAASPEPPAAEPRLTHPSVWRTKLLVTTLHTSAWDDIWHLSLLSCPQGLLLCRKRRADFSDRAVFWGVLPNTLFALLQSWELHCPAIGSVVLWLLLQLFFFFFEFNTFPLFCSGNLFYLFYFILYFICPSLPC